MNFCQVYRECKSYYRNFKLDINKCYNENGESCINTKELYDFIPAGYKDLSNLSYSKRLQYLR